MRTLTFIKNMALVLICTTGAITSAYSLDPSQEKVCGEFAKCLNDANAKSDQLAYTACINKYGTMGYTREQCHNITAPR